MRIATLAKSVAVGCLSIFALTANAESLELLSASPEAGDVAKLSSVLLSVSGNSLSMASDAATVVDSNAVSYPCTATVGRAGITVTLDEEITTPGTYTLAIAAGAITDAYTSDTNEAISLVYNVTGETSDTAIFTWGTPDPAPGVVESISKIVIETEIDENVSVAVNSMDQKGATITGPKGAVDYTKITCNSRSHKVTIFFAEEITDPGTYTVTIPEGWVLNAAEEGISPELTFSYTIEAPLPVYELDLYSATTNPVANEWGGDPVDSLEVIQLTLGSNEDLAVTNPNTKAVAKDAAGNVLCEGALSVEEVNTGRWTLTYAVVRLETPITTPGEVTVIIPEGAFSGTEVDDDWNPITVAYGEIDLHYTIKALLEANVTATPADGSTVSSLVGDIDIAYNDCLTDGLYFKNGIESTAAVIKDSEGTALTAYILEYGETGHIKFTIPEEDAITEAGTYTVTIPGGEVLNGVSDDAYAEVVLTYTVGAALPIFELDEYGVISNPTAGEWGDPVDSLDEIQLMIGSNEDIAVADPNAKAVAKDAEGNILGEGALSVETVNLGRYTSICGIIRFENPITTPGEVTVTVPAGAFSGTEVDDDWNPITVAYGEFSLTYTIKALLEAEVTATPDDGTEMSSLVGVIDIAYDDCLTDGVYFKNGIESAAAVIKDSEGNALTAYILEYGETGHIKFEIPEEDAITEIGTYTVTIPAGEIVNMSTDEAYAEAVITYVVKAPVFNPEIDPEEGEVSSLSQVNLTFTTATAVKINDEAGRNDFPYLAMVNDEGELSKVAQWMGLASGNVLTVKPYGAAYTEAGDYLVVIPGNFFTIDGYAQETIYLEYTIVAPVADFMYDFQVTNIEEDGTIAELTTIDFEFTAMDENWEPIAEGITYKHDSFKNVTLQRLDDSWSPVEAYGGTITGVDPQLSWAPSYAVTDNGTYLFTIPDGYMTMTNEAGASVKSEAIYFVFYLDTANGVKTINATELEKNVIYNLNGIKVGTDFSKLPAGVYIVNGKKVVKK